MSDTETIDPPAPASEPAPTVTADDAPPSSDPPAAAPESQPGTVLPAADAIAKAMAKQAEEAAALEREELRANGVDLATVGAPRAQPLPGFEPPPFDLVGALRTIGSKNRGVAEAKAEWESAKEEAATLKKAYDREVDGLSAIIRDMEERQRDSVARQPRLVPTGSPALSCQYEQTEGKPCPVCIRLKAADAPPPSPDDTEHAANVRMALEPMGASELADFMAVSADWFIEPSVIDGWTAEQRADVQIFTAVIGEISEGSNRPARQAILGTPHVADVAGDHVQSCKGCGVVLVDLAKPDVDAYDEGTLIGTDCEPPAAADKAEPTDNTEPPADEPPLEEVMAEAKVCLCQAPAVVDNKCLKCGGTPQPEKPTKKRKAH